MNAVHWVRFAWELEKFTTVPPSLPPSYAIRRAIAEERATVTAVALSTFTLNSDWNPSFKEVRPLIEKAIHDVFHEKNDPFCLIVTHGSRIIGASGLSAENEAPNHLLTGPCLSLEYQNRGLASALLAHSLLALKEAGVTTARGVTKQGSCAAQFIYSKFGSISLAEGKK